MTRLSSGGKTIHTPSTPEEKILYTLSLFHFRKPSGPKSLSPNRQDWNGIQSIRSSKMHLGCNPLGTLNINMKNLKPWATRQLRQIAKHCEEPCSLPLISPCNNNTQLHSEPAAGNGSFMQVAQCTACISLIDLPFHKDMHHDYHQGIQTELDLILIAIKLTVASGPWIAASGQ